MRYKNSKSAGPDAPISTFSISKILNSKSENSLLRGKIDKYERCS